MKSKIFRSTLFVAAVVLICGLSFIMGVLYDYFDTVQRAQLQDELSLAAIGTKPSGDAWQIGVRDPFSQSTSTTLGTLALSDAFVSTSGSYEKCFTYEGETYHHILDPKTGKPCESDLLSVTVVAPSGTLSDMLSTACFLVGSEEAFSLASEYGASILAVTADGTLLASASLKGVFTPNAGWEAVYR